MFNKMSWFNVFFCSLTAGLLPGCQGETDPSSVEVAPEVAAGVARDAVGDSWSGPAGLRVYEAFGLPLLDPEGSPAGAITLWTTEQVGTAYDWAYDDQGVAMPDGRLSEEGTEDPRLGAIQDALSVGAAPDTTDTPLFTTITTARRDMDPVLHAALGVPDTLTNARQALSLLGDPTAQCLWLQRVVLPADGSLWISCQTGDARRLVNVQSGEVRDPEALSAEPLPSLDAPERARQWDALEDAFTEPMDEELGGACGPAPFTVMGLLSSLTGAAEGHSTDTACGTSGCSGSSCGTSYGTSLGSLDSHKVYSQGSCAGTGTGCYQCVEYVKRFKHKCGTSMGNACTYWAYPYYSSYSHYFFKMSNGGSSYAPYPGDILYSSNSSSCSDSYPGHVSIVGAVSSSTVTVYDQNFSSSSASASLSYSTSSGYSVGNRSTSYTTYGWLRTGWDLPYSSSSPVSSWSTSSISSISSGSSGSTSYARLTSMSTTTRDPYITSPDNLNINPSNSYGGKYVAVRLRTNATSRTLRVYFITSTDSTWDETKAVSATIPSGTDWNTVSVDMSSNTSWTGATLIRQIRVDPISTVSSTSEYVDLDYVRVTTN